MGKTLVVSLNKKNAWVSSDTLRVIDNLDIAFECAKRADLVILDTEKLTKPMLNFAKTLQHADIEMRLINHMAMLDDIDKIISLLHTATCERSIGRMSSDERYRTWRIIFENNIPYEVVEHIDDYLNHELLSAYDITINETMLLCEKKNTYKPTDLNRKEWGVSDPDFAFSHDDRATYKMFATLADKLTAYVTLQYYIANGLDSHEYNETKTGNLSRKALAHAMECSGHSAYVPPVDENQEFYTAYTYQRMLYSDDRDM